MRMLQRALAVCLLVLCGILVGYVGYRAAHRPTLIAVNSTAATSAAPLAVTPAADSASAPSGASGASGVDAGTPGSATKAAAVPEDVPDIHMPDLTGKEQSLRAYLGHPLIINFWATWCEPCRREMPLLQQLWTQNRATGLNVVGIALDSPSAVEQYLQHTHVGYPLLVGEDAGSAAVGRFGIEPVLPFSVFADAKGQIVAVKIGELHEADANFIVAAVEKVTQGSETLPQARAAIATELKQLAVQRAKQAVRSGT
jgi:thiol-disulfide isomerase/thioredoxin